VGQLLLENLGYQVLSAQGGNEALEIYRLRKDEIDLVLLDMVMPGMSGSETFDAIKAINPDAKVILSSGYSINGQAQKIIDRGCSGFVQKPYSMKDISTKLRHVLDTQD
jgi:CheY-like chemotaxis protein